MRTAQQHHSHHHNWKNNSSSPAVPLHHLAPSARGVDHDDHNYYYVVHQGRMKRTFEELPQIASMTLASGWTKQRTQDLKNGIQRCVHENPILSGIVLMRKDGIFIEPGYYQPESHNFWSVDLSLLEESTTLSKKWVTAIMSSPQGRLQFVEQEVASRLPKIVSIPEEAKHQKPLFHVHLIPLPNDHLVYSFRLSHAVGDATTYYQLIHQVMALVGAATRQESKPMIQKIDWQGVVLVQDRPTSGVVPTERTKNNKTVSHIDSTQPQQQSQHSQPPEELYLDHMSKRDIENLYGVPFMVGVIPRFVEGTKRQKYVLLSKDQIRIQKKHQKSSSVDYLTTNDVVVASICRANKRVKVMCQYVNTRPNNHHHYIDDHHRPVLGGNYLHEIPFSRKAATNPNVVRRITNHGIYYQTNQVPLIPSLTNKIGKISNWSSCTTCSSSLEEEGTTTKVLAHIPTPDQVNGVPLDYAVIFEYDDNHIGLLHNFDEELVDLTEMMMTLS